jgi:hypothetical protein
MKDSPSMKSLYSHRVKPCADEKCFLKKRSSVLVDGDILESDSGGYMEAIRSIQLVEGDSITIRNLERFKGERVEVIILPCADGDEVSLDPEWEDEIDKRWERYSRDPKSSKPLEEVMKDAVKIIEK